MTAPVRDALPDLPAGAVVAALRALLPDAEHTLLLRACLSAEDAATAWAQWRAQHDLHASLAHDQVGAKGLLPLLAYHLEQRGVPVAAADLSLLRMARYREELRMVRFQTILRQVLAALDAAQIRCLLLKGAALAHTVYPAPTLRHCHDIDLLIHPDDLPRAVDLLAACDFAAHGLAGPGERVVRGESIRLIHSSELPLLLHACLFHNSFYALSVEAALQQACPLEAGVPARTLAPAWELVHIVGCVLSARARISWVCDAYLLLAAHPHLDWSQVVALAETSRLALPAAVMLAYLREQFGAPVPTAVLGELVRSCTTRERADSEQIWQSTRNRRAITDGELLAAAATWQERARLVRWMLLPLPTTLRSGVRAGARTRSPFFLLRFTLGRGLDYLARHIHSIKTLREP